MTKRSIWGSMAPILALCCVYVSVSAQNDCTVNTPCNCMETSGTCQRVDFFDSSKGIYCECCGDNDDKVGADCNCKTGTEGKCKDRDGTVACSCDCSNIQDTEGMRCDCDFPGEVGKTGTCEDIEGGDLECNCDCNMNNIEESCMCESDAQGTCQMDPGNDINTPVKCYCDCNDPNSEPEDPCMCSEGVAGFCDANLLGSYCNCDTS